MREAWTDDRLDDLNHRVDEGFRELRQEAQVLRAEMNLRFEAVDKRFEGVDGRLDGIQRSIAQLAVALTGAILVGFGGITALIATQL